MKSNSLQSVLLFLCNYYLCNPSIYVFLIQSIIIVNIEKNICFLFMSSTLPTHYVSYADIHHSVKLLTEEIGLWRELPSLIVAIGTGGLVPGRILKSFLRKPLLFVTVNLYDENTEQRKETHTKIQWINDEKSQIEGQHNLIVDEVDDTRQTLAYVTNELSRASPASISWLVICNKNKLKRASVPTILKNYFVAFETDDIWIKFPWDALDLEEHEKLAKELDSIRLKRKVDKHLIMEREE